MGWVMRRPRSAPYRRGQSAFEKRAQVKRDIIVIGASAGGVEAVPRLLSSLQANIRASFFVTLHISPHNESIMPKLIEDQGRLMAEHPLDGARIQQGHVYVAPPDFHLLLGKGVVQLGHGPKENRHRPAIDVLFRTAEEAYGRRVASILLTGNLDDGVAGLQRIQQLGGMAIVQDPREAPYPDMPRNALNAFHPDHCLPLKGIESLISVLSKNGGGGRKMKARKGTSRGGQPANSKDAMAKGAAPFPLVCPECEGPLWEFRNGKVHHYECLGGHRYTLESLLAAHSEEVETSLWVALRALEERINLEKRLAKEAETGGRKHNYKLFAARLADNQKHADVLREILEKIRKS